jgi:hypothetical protein
MNKLASIKFARRQRVEKVIDSSALRFIKQVGKRRHGKIQQNVIVAAGSKFKNPNSTLQDVIGESIKKTLSIQPYKHLDPSAFEANEKLSELEMKRIRVRRYMTKLKEMGIPTPNTVKSIIRSLKPMTDSQAELALSLLLKHEALWTSGGTKTGRAK